MSAAVWELTAESELHDLLNVLGWYAGNITQSVITDHWVREEVQAKRGTQSTDTARL